MNRKDKNTDEKTKSKAIIRSCFFIAPGCVLPGTEKPLPCGAAPLGQFNLGEG